MRRVVFVLAAVGCRFADNPAKPDASAPGDAPRPIDGAIAHDAPHDTPPDAAPPEVTFVQGSGTVNSNWGNGGDTLALTMPDAIGSGDAIAVFVSWADQGSLGSITDSLGNTFTVVKTVDDGNQNQEGAVAYAQDVIGGSDTITAHFGSSPCCRVLLAHEVRGASISSAAGSATGQVQTAGNGSNAVTSTFVDAGSGDYVFGVSTDVAGTTNQTIAAGTDETLRESLLPGGGNGNATASEDRVVTGSGSAASTFTYGKSGEQITLELVLKP
jgi:hypothetical protein